MVRIYTKKENDILLHMRAQGVPFKQIAETLGRSEAALWMKYKKLKEEESKNKKSEKTDLVVDGVKVAEVESSLVVKNNKQVEKQEPRSNNDSSSPARNNTEQMTPRDMIKHLYDLGYRIEDNKLVCYVRQVVKINDILAEV